MNHLTRICAAALIAILPACTAQTARHSTKAHPKPAPTEQELFEFVRGQLLAYSPDDGINNNIEVTLDPNTQVMTLIAPDGHCDVFLNALDANTLVWDIFDASDSTATRQKLLRLTVISESGKPARTCYDKRNQVDKTILTNRTRFLFSLYLTDQMPDFQDKMTKAVKDLITAGGGLPERKLY
jgi:hypothetical protein